MQDVIDVAYVASILLKDDEEEDHNGNNTTDISTYYHENTTTATPTASNPPFLLCPRVILKKLQEVKRKFNSYLASINLSSAFPDVCHTSNKLSTNID